jgi:hypothetical protein
LRDGILETIDRQFSFRGLFLVMESAAPDTKSTDASRAAAQTRARRCRIGAVISLLLGVISAGLVYWLEPREPDYSDDPSMLGFNRAAHQQMAVLYGKQGQLIEDLDDSLKQPGTQAILIIVASAIIAAGFFYFARMLECEATAAAADPHSDRQI